MAKKILILGGTYFQIPVIKYARSAGYYVITCDFIPENPGHKLADENHNVSTTDLDGVLALATKLRIDGILAYASDPAAPTAAFVSEKLRLPGNSYECVRIMAHKDYYRAFLAQHGFPTPKMVAGLGTGDSSPALASLKFPLMVKPVDSSGSKGVSKIESMNDLPGAIAHAAQFSRANRVVAEEFLQRKGPQIGGEAFVSNGRLVFMCLGDQLVDATCNPYVPAGMTFPAKVAPTLAVKIAEKIQQLITALDFKVGGLNLEIMLDDEERIFLMEVGPRTGGNFLPELVHHATGFNVAAASVESALGQSIEKILPLTAINVPDAFFAYYAIHSNRSGILQSLQIEPSLVSAIIELHQFIPVGGRVQAYHGSNCTIGIMLLRFGTVEEMHEKISSMDQRVKVGVSEAVEVKGVFPSMAQL